ncbi:MAG: polyprenyl synthetase family protein [bacterium]|nr:polyprenyl synthetase family protein [bacterium]
MDVAAYMAERIPLVDRAIEARLDGLASGEAPIPANLAGAMRHLLFPGGKRLRPVMALAAAEAVGGPAEAALPLGVAVELVHTYSLIHDDLPCMDDDDLRRGRPTVHKAFDEATAVLAGDALLTEAFSVLSEDAHAADAQIRLDVVGLLSRSSGALGLVGGQVDDLAFEAAGGDTGGTSAGFLASIHARKTAALFRASIEGGAMLAGANAGQREALERFSRDVGIGFQIADDVLDADSGEAASILRLQGIDDAKHGAEGLLDRALGEIDGWGEAAEPLRALARFAIRRER